MSVDGDPRSGRHLSTLTTENIDRMHLAIEKDRRSTVRELENHHKIPKTCVSRIF